MKIVSATTWTIIAIIAFSLAGISLIVAIFIFFKMDILAVIGDLSGKTVAKEIRAMKEAELSGQKKTYNYNPKSVNLGEDGIRKIAVSEQMAPMPQQSTVDPNATEVLSSDATEVLDMGATEVLTSNATEVLEAGATEVLTTDVVQNETAQGATEVLSTNMVDGTSVLGATEDLAPQQEIPVEFQVFRSIIYIHSDEVIT